MVLLGGIVGAKLAPSLEWATLPLASLVIGTACTTIPASLTMSRYGRKAGFLSATCFGVLSGLVAAWSLVLEHFPLFCFSSFLAGAYAAFLQQFRFAVAESVPQALVARCVSLLMLAGIVAAFLGPEMAQRFTEVEGLPQYAGSFIGLSALVCCSFVVVLFYRNQELDTQDLLDEPRRLGELVRQPVLMLAVASAVVAWSIMTLVMTATPVSMHEMDHYSLADTSWVIQSHILAMYVPSLFSGFLIGWFGAMRIIQAGVLLMIACLIMGYGNPGLMHYWGSMVLLGVGWNFLFLGGTTLLTQSYRVSERFKVQAMNDFLMFGLQAFAALGAGLMLAKVGWNGVIFLSLPWLVILLPFMWIARRLPSN